MVRDASLRDAPHHGIAPRNSSPLRRRHHGDAAAAAAGRAAAALPRLRADQRAALRREGAAVLRPVLDAAERPRRGEADLALALERAIAELAAEHALAVP